MERAITGRVLSLAVRRAYGLSQAELAKRMGRNHSTVYRWEKGSTEPSPEDVRHLEVLLGAAPTPLAAAFAQVANA